MHGLGDSAEGFADVAQMWSRQLPYAKFVLPTAPTQPVTLNGGMPMPSWYDIEGLSERTNENCNGIEESRATVMGILDAEAAAGLPYSRMGEILCEERIDELRTPILPLQCATRSTHHSAQRLLTGRRHVSLFRSAAP